MKSKGKARGRPCETHPAPHPSNYRRVKVMVDVRTANENMK